jgi:hypothetical protein
MSEWLAKALAARTASVLAVSEACANCANCAKTSAEGMQEGGFGTNGTIGTGSQIPLEDPRSRFEWIRRRLVEEHGRDPELSRADALAILRADLLNDARLMPVQADTMRCLVCEDTSSPGRHLVPVLSARPNDWLWMHLKPCHNEYLKRQRVKVEQILAAVMAIRDAAS